MKKIFLITLIALPTLAFAQSDAANKTQIDSLLINAARKNNAAFFHRIFINSNNSKLNKDSAAFKLTTTGSGAATYNLGTKTLNIPNNLPTFPANAPGVLKNNGSGTYSWIADVSSLNTSWTTVTLINSWSGNTNNVLQWRYGASGRVELRGRLVDTSATNSNVCAAAAVPNPINSNGSAQTIYIPIVDANDFSITYIIIGSNGQIAIPTHTNLHSYEFSGITYSTSN